MKTDDEYANDRADAHKRLMSKQREVDGLTNLVPHIRMPKLRPYIPEAESHSEQLNEE